MYADKDDLDDKVIARLVDDARTTYADIGDELGLSAPAVKRRVERLQEKGVIRGFTTVVHPDVLGWRTEAFVELYCGGKIFSEDILRTLEGHPEIADLCTVAGEPDAVVRLLAADVQHLEEALERIRSEPYVLRTRSIIVLSRLLERPGA